MLDLEGDDSFFMEEDKMGMKITSGSVKLSKDEKNLIGISIGGGAPLCPCLYVVQVSENGAVASDGTLQCGDEITAVNGDSVKGKSKVEVAKMIKGVKGEVCIAYNKLHADPKQGKTLDIILKKVKHRMVENMSSATADALGLSRAILCNDSLVKKMEELERNEFVYKGLAEHTKQMLRAFFDVCRVYRAFGDVFAGIGVREPQPRASEAFTQFGEAHRTMEKLGIKFLKTVKPMMTDLGTYLNKAVPDTKLTIKKYADVKFEYLSYCLKVKEMDDEEYTYQALQEPLYRVETGNYEYRLILRCRQDARARFSKLRSDVLVKLELLDQKHVQDIVFQMNRLLTALSQYNQNCYNLMQETNVFPIELDLPQTTFQYSETSASSEFHDDDDDEEEDVEPLVIAEEALADPKQDDDLLEAFLADEKLPKQLVSLNLLED
ncbi:PRKCA-binding protein-like isoform X2 [Uloborus diversus]|uniref:PRKCA-binding protein-like isoform X2 n=1 Tax=Uloborus diversus TaxID=327109 RepID=UPI00240943A8|nr:PRKCA-binding protein-like isoform X2 [Uloborus diversus]